MKFQSGTFFTVPKSLMKRQDLSTSEKMVMIAFLEFSDREGYCYPSYNTIAKRSRLSRRTVIRIVDGLTKRGFLRKIQLNFKRSNLFQICPKGGGRRSPDKDESGDKRTPDKCQRDTRFSDTVSPELNPETNNHKKTFASTPKSGAKRLSTHDQMVEYLIKENPLSELCLKHYRSDESVRRAILENPNAPTLEEVFGDHKEEILKGLRNKNGRE